MNLSDGKRSVMIDAADEKFLAVCCDSALNSSGGNIAALRRRPYELVTVFSYKNLYSRRIQTKL